MINDWIIKIVLSGIDNFTNLYQKDPKEIIIGVDGGLESISNLGLRANIGIGDFDSFPLSKAKTISNEIIQYKPEKNSSDLELALEYAITFNPKKIVIYNGMGFRQDHFIAAVELLKKFDNYDIEMLDQYNSIFVINSETVFNPNEFKYISFFKIVDETIISLDGFKYPLDNYEMNDYDGLCLSNEIISNKAIVKTNKKILVVRSK